jgi:hypothetical protein
LQYLLTNTHQLRSPKIKIAMSRDKKPLEEADLTLVKRFSIGNRLSKVNTDAFAKPPQKGQSFKGFYDSLPGILNTKNFDNLILKLVEAKEKGSPIIWSMGGHVVKVGLGPIIRYLIDEGWVQAIVMNSAASIHDSEVARFGETSEDVAQAIKDGSFGMAEETSVEYLDALNSGITEGYGWGESISKWLADEKHPTGNYSILNKCWEKDIPVTIHGALGTDIIWQHPECDGQKLGLGGERDFKKLIKILSNLEGGVYLNWGSAVILPEVFLKAFTCARNLGSDLKVFSTANFDQIQHYRPRVNILDRPTSEGGSKFSFTGHHEFLFPLLAQSLIDFK